MIRKLTTMLLAALVSLPLMAGEAAPPVSAQDVSPGYQIGPGDKIQVYVWQNPELSVTVPVRQDGKVSTPLVEDMVAAGKTASALARDIEAVLAEYVRTPTVNVFVMEAVSAFSQIRVTGQVKNQQALAFREGMTVLDAILAVGGLTDFAAPNRAKIVRSEEGENEELRVRLGDLLNDGDMRQNLALRPGDVLLVPQSRF